MPLRPDIEVVTTSERPDLEEEASAAFRAEWPEFIFHDPVVGEHIGRVWLYFGDYEVLLLDAGAVVAGGWGVPLAWNGSVPDLPAGYDDALVRAVAGRENGVGPDTLCVTGAAVHADQRGQGLAGQVLTELRDRAAHSDPGHVIVPMRPTLKSRYLKGPRTRSSAWPATIGTAILPRRWHRTLGTLDPMDNG